MIKALDEFYLNKTEPLKSCFMALRSMILNYHPDIDESWKYGLPFFNYKGKMFCYLHTDKQTKMPYIGIMQGKHIEHPALIQGNRKRVKTLTIDPEKDLPLDQIHEIFQLAINTY